MDEKYSRVNDHKRYRDSHDSIFGKKKIKGHNGTIQTYNETGLITKKQLQLVSTLKINEPPTVKTEVDLFELPNCLFRAYISAYVDDSVFPTNYVSIDFDIFTIIATTPKGVWISNTHDKRLLTNAQKNDKWKWVSLESIKRFAYPTKKEAMDSLRIRKQKHLYHLQHQINTYKIGLEILEIHKEK